MKKNLIMLLSLVCVVSAMAQKPKIAVYVTGEDSLNFFVGSRLMECLSKNGRYSVVERTDLFLKALDKEHRYERSGAVDENLIAKLGNQFGAQYVCVASILTVWHSEKYISARIIDVKNAEVLATGCSNGIIVSSDDLNGVLNRLSSSLMTTMSTYKRNDAAKVGVYVERTGNFDIDVVLADQLVSFFAFSDRYVAVERSQRFLSQIHKEVGYQHSGAVDDDDWARMGKQLGVRYVCVASARQYDGKYYISTRLIDVSKVDIVNIHNVNGVPLGSFHSVDSVARVIATKISGRTIEEEAKYQDMLRQGYVDLGLPSGTLWKNSNETLDGEEYFSFEEAKARFGDRLPSRWQCEELLYCAQISWDSVDNGYWFGFREIFLPARGHKYGDTVLHSRAQVRDLCYLLSESNDDEYYVAIFPGYYGYPIGPLYDGSMPSLKHSVRLTYCEDPDTAYSYPEFPAGRNEFVHFLNENIKYPDLARDGGITGRVFAKFIIEDDGTVSNVMISRDIGGGCGDELKRALRSMPKWKPATRSGVPVRSKPIVFSLDFILR